MNKDDINNLIKSIVDKFFEFTDLQLVDSSGTVVSVPNALNNTSCDCSRYCSDNDCDYACYDN